MGSGLVSARDLEVEKVDFLYAGSPLSLAVGAVAALIMVVVHWQVVPGKWLLGWLGTFAVVLAGRAFLVLMYRRAAGRGAASGSAWLRRFRLASLAGGCSWGLGSLVLSQSGDPVYQAFVAFAMAGVSAGAITALATDRVATLYFVVPMLAPLSLGFLLKPETLAFALGSVVLIFLLFLAATSARIEGYLKENARLRLRAEAQQRLIQTNEMRWRFALERSGLGMWDWEIDTGKVFYSPCWKKMLGFAEDYTDTSMGEWRSRVHPEDRDTVDQELKRHLQGETPFYETEHRIGCRDGNHRWVLDRGQIIERTLEGVPRRMIGVHIDVTERKQAETELRIAATVFDAQEGIIITDGDETILRVNRAFTEMTGYASEEVIGKTPRVLKSGRHDANFYAAMWASILHTGSWQGEIWNRRKSGDVYPEWLNITALRQGAGQVTRYVATLHDITERKAAEEAIRHLAFYDALTLLPNRRLLLDRLDHACLVGERSGRVGALLFIDLDRFKDLNDNFGHAVGDLLLQEVARRLRGSVRDLDTVARLGGDEFVVMLEDLGADAAAAERPAADIASKILATLTAPYQLAGQLHQSTPSIGIILFQGQQVPTEEVLRRADLAMYRAKESGRRRFCFFDPSMQASADTRTVLREELRQGIGQDEFLLHYQPQVDGDGRLIGAEALIRWENPHRKLLAPNDFIPLAEESGLILPLGQWVLESVCAQLQAWSRHPEWAKLTLSINISPRQFRDADFIARILRVLEATGADPRRLNLELSESLLSQDPEATILRMEALKACGLRFSLDNYGTGHSALADLRNIPVDQLKLGHFFVRDLQTDPKVAAIARSVITLGNALGLEVVAAGVETEAQKLFLQAHSCQAFQGYLFSRPLTLEELGRSRLKVDP